MAATLSRHHGSYARPHKALPITMSTKTSPTYNHPVSRAAMEPPELSDTSTIYSSRRSGGTLSDISDENDDHKSSRSSRYRDFDVLDELSDRMNSTEFFDPTRMDRIVVKQAQNSGSMNAKQRELEEEQAALLKRMRRARATINDEIMPMAAEARKDVEYSKRKHASNKAKAVQFAEDREESRRSRHARR